MCCDFAAVAPSDESRRAAELRRAWLELERRVARLRRARPELERAVARHLLDLYRRRRKMLPGPLAALLSPRTRTRIIARGEIEHVLGLNLIIPAVRDAALRLAARLRHPGG